MAYLYGDSTESPLDINYIEFLRDALDFSVEVLVADHRVQGLREGEEDHQRQVEVELGLLQQLSEQVVRALESPPGGPQSAAFRCAVSIRQSADDAIKRTAAQLKQSVSDHQTQMTGQVRRERQNNLRAIEILLRHGDLPGSTHFSELLLDSSQSGYAAQVRGQADIGLEWAQALDIRSGHLFANLVKVERLSPNLEVRVPERGGWMRKGMRLRSHRISGKYVTEVVRALHQTTVKLRATPDEEDSGYNILVTAMEPRVRLVRVQKGGEHSPPFEPLEEDAPKFLALAAELEEALEGLLTSRGALREARIDGVAIGDHENLSILVTRLISKISPVVQEMSRHSLSPEELVLKQVLADDRREEIFAAKADLLAKLDPVPLGLRGVFAPLGLGDLGRTRNGRASAAPAPRPESLPTASPGSLTIKSAAASPGRLAEPVADSETKEILITRPDDPPPAPRTTRPRVLERLGDPMRLSGPAALTRTMAAGPRPGSRTAPPPSPRSAPPPGMGPPRGMPGTTNPGFGGSPPGAPAGREARPPVGDPTGDDDVTIVAAAAPNQRGPKPGEDSIDVALSELEQES